uniref:SWIB domain-containing protein n=1 Tax=Ascaris lumbricoides TaxID=6252 RepID=A0A0M3IU48_ASCLU
MLDKSVSNTPAFPTPTGGGDCNAIRKNPQNAALELIKRHLVNPVEDLSSRQLLSIDDITRAVSTGCVPQNPFYKK